MRGRAQSAAQSKVAVALVLVPALVLVLRAAPAHADLPFVNVSPSFPPGPYSALYVDPSDPRRVAVGTASGLVAWSSNAGQMAHEARALSPRRYDAMALRGRSARGQLARQGGGGSAEGAVSCSSDAECPGAQTCDRDSGTCSGGGGRGRLGGASTQRAVRLFIRAMRSGAGYARWAFWMAIGEPFTEVSALAMPPGGGRMAAASPAGLLLSDRSRLTWTRTHGGPGPMPREDDLAAFSITIDPNDPRHLLAGTSRGVVVSNNGGFTFAPHPDPLLQEEYVFGFHWDPVQPDLLLAITYNAVLQSYDAGRTFQVAFSASGTEVFGATLTDWGALVATGDGLVVIDGSGSEQKLLRGQKVVGVAPFPNGVVAATATSLWLLSTDGERVPLAHTTEQDPFLALRGGEGLAWALTSYAIYRIGGPSIERMRVRRPPRLAMSLVEVEQAVRELHGFEGPEDVRLHERWYSKLVPTVVVDVVGYTRESDGTMLDGTFPIRFREAHATNEARLEWSIMATWDLSKFVFGDHNVVNPSLFLETQLREGRKMMMEEVRRRYREAGALVRRLEHPPADPVQRLLWQMRLEEHASYLEALTGQQVVEGEML